MARKNEAHEIVVESITDALLILMKQKPLSEINVSELCNKAGVSRVSFYRNFTSLEDILLKYLKKCTDDWWVEFSKKSEEEIQQTFWPALLRQYKNHTELINLLKKNDVTHILKEHIFPAADQSLSTTKNLPISAPVLQDSFTDLLTNG